MSASISPACWREALEVRGGRPVLLTNCRQGEGIDAVVAAIERDVLVPRVNGVAPASAPQLDLAFARRGDRTVLDRRLFRWPFVLTRTFALDRAPAHMLTVIVQTSSGAVHGGDRLRQRHRGRGGRGRACDDPGRVMRLSSGPRARKPRSRDSKRRCRRLS